MLYSAIFNFNNALVRSTAFEYTEVNMNRQSEYLIRIPEILNTKEVVNFSWYLFSIKANLRYRRYILDFSKAKRAFPFGILFLGKLLRNFIKMANDEYDDIEFVCRYKDSYDDIESYLQHIGFFRYIGVTLGREPGEAHGSNYYIPIRVFSKKILSSEADKKKKHIGDVIIDESESIADILDSAYEHLDEDNVEFLKRAIAYSSREIMRNSIEHSQDEEVAIFVQSFPRLKRVDIAIMDNGVGIYSTLAEKYKLSSGTTAIETALLPGVSRTDTDIKTNDDWQNSGFGLYIVSELCKELNNSNLYIASSDATYSISKTGIYTKDSQVWAPGTTTLISLGSDNDCYFSNILEQIVQRGESIAKSSNHNATASKMSKKA